MSELPLEKQPDKPDSPPLKPKQKELLDGILADSKISPAEFKAWMNSVNQDLELTKEELEKSRAMYKKALEDNSTNIQGIAEINKAWSSNVPAPVHNEMVKQLTDLKKSDTKLLVIMFLIALGVIFLESMLPILSSLPGLLAGG